MLHYVPLTFLPYLNIRSCLRSKSIFCPSPQQSKDVTIQDTIRGEVTWNTDTLGDFVLLRSSGLPVYNFCVAIDDCLMGITHVIRFVWGMSVRDAAFDCVKVQ